MMVSNFSNASAFRPWPLGYGDKQGGSYAAFGNANAYGGGSSANMLVSSLRWTNTDYDMVIWGVMVQGLISSAFTSNQIAQIAFYRATSFTVADSGGSDVASTFGSRRNSTMPEISSFDGYSFRIADAGTTGLTVGTRTLGNILYSDSIQTGTVSSSLTKSGQYRSFINNPVVIHENEGIVGYGVYALTGGTIIPQLMIDFDIVPTEVTARFYT